VLCGLLLALPGVPPPAAANAEAAVSTDATVATFGPAAIDGTVFRPPAGVSLLLAEGASGHVLVAHDAQRRRPVASTIKLLTALVVVDRIGPGAIVEIGPEVLGVDGASFGLRPGERWTVEDLLVGLLLRSGNEVAESLAVAAAGSSEAFILAMAERLELLGIGGVVPASPTGLERDDALSAEELAIIARSALAEPRIAGIVGLRTATVGTGATSQNRNLLIGRYAGATGLKTGFTEPAGHTLVASARRDGRELIAVVLGARTEEERFRLAERLLDHGFTSTSFERFEQRIELRSGAGRVMLAVGPVPVSHLAGREVVALWEPRLRPDDPIRTVALSSGTRGLGSVDVARVDARQIATGTASVGQGIADGVYAGLRAAGLAGSLR
jgi:D-alanyl-D-alanine carboxypeptidase